METVWGRVSRNCCPGPQSCVPVAECTDHIIAVGESHLRRVLNEFVAYYNESRTHQSPHGNAPERRRVQALGQVTAEPVLGGLHQRYSRAA